MQEKQSLLSIDAIPRETHDEASRQKYVSFLRKFIMSDLSSEMKDFYFKDVSKAIVYDDANKQSQTVKIRRAMEKTLFYKVWSSLRFNAQEMTWSSVQNQVERSLPDLVKVSKDAAKIKTDKASLSLDPNLEVPKYVSKLDIHQMPGCFHTEYVSGDVAVGAVYAHGTKVFGGAMKKSANPGKGGVADTISNYLKIKYPNFKPKRILDIGCTIGSNLLPYKKVFPEAELYGIDVGAPVLRYGHARAVSMNIPVHFSQQNAEKTNFSDGFFDLIVSSFFFHEIPTKSSKLIVREIYRLLSSKGITVHMELPSVHEVDPYYNFYIDWDAYHNNEPHYASFRKQNPIELLVNSGFKEENSYILHLPDRGGVSDHDFSKVVKGDGSPPKHGNYSSYYFFGALK